MNLTYFHLSHGLDRAQRAQLDETLTEPARKEEARDKMNAQAMMDPRLRGGLLAPPPRK